MLKIDVSIIIPTYNNAEVISDCLNSALDQDCKNIRCEIICIDDASTDDTINIIESYKDKGVVLVKKPSHTGLADAIEMGIKQAQGRNMIILNPNQKLLSHACTEIAKMDNHSVICLTDQLRARNMDEYGNKYQDLNTKNVYNFDIDYNSVIITSNFKELYFEKLPQWFYSYYRGNIIEQFVMYCLSHGIPTSVRLGNSFINEKRSLSIGGRNLFRKVDKSNSDLTICITFRNEGNEIEQTIKSIKYTCKNPNILLVDDCSDDGLRYDVLAEMYDCEYVRSVQRIGCVGARMWIGSSVKTKYFMLLDGHMRFYENDWDERITKIMDENPNTILSSRTVHMQLGENKRLLLEDSWEPECMRAHNAKVDFDGQVPYEPLWIYENEPGVLLREVPCILGACYVTSKEWWKYIDGLNGMSVYGLDEVFLSLKTWMMGGFCKSIEDFGVGHLYRIVNPNHCLSNDMEFNRLLIAYIFDEDFEGVKKKIRENVGDRFDEIYEHFENRLELTNQIKNYVTSRSTRTIQWFKEGFNNNYKTIRPEKNPILTLQPEV